MKRLEKPARNVPTTKSSLLSNDLRTKASASEGSKHLPFTSNSGGSVESLTTAATPASSSEPMAKLKSKRRLNNTIGGPVISSGLAGKRDPRFRHSTGRLSSSLGAKNIGSFLGDEDESKDMSVVQNQKLDVRDDNVSTYSCIYRLRRLRSKFISHFCLDNTKLSIGTNNMYLFSIIRVNFICMIYVIVQCVNITNSSDNTG